MEKEQLKRDIPVILSTKRIKEKMDYLVSDVRYFAERYMHAEDVETAEKRKRILEDKLQEFSDLLANEKPRMLVDTVEFSDPEHFRESLKVAKEMGKKNPAILESFKRSVVVLNRLKRNMKAKLFVHPDFVKHSHSWYLSKLDAYRKPEKCVYNGGMILHGFQETFSVELNAPNHPHWSIHT